MRLQMTGKTFGVFCLVAWCVALVIKNLGYFFLTSAQTDMQFRVVGDIFQVILLIAILLATYRALRAEKAAQTWSRASIRKRILVGVAVGIVSISLDWKHFFPNGQVEFRAGLDDLAFGLFLGTLVVLIGLHSWPDLKTSDSEQENLIV